MSNSLDHQEIRELLGACAVDAVDGPEREAIAVHLRTCADCRDEMDELLRISSLLGSGPALAPDGLWDRIEERLSDPGTMPRPLNLELRRKRGRFVAWGRSVAVAAAVALIVSTAAVTAVVRNDSDGNSREQIAVRSADAQGARTVMLTSQDGATTARTVLLPDGRGFILDSNLPQLEEGKTYQLWAVMGQSAISAGVLGIDPAFSPFTAAGDVTALAITEEVAGGVVSSQNRPMLSGVVQPA